MKPVNAERQIPKLALLQAGPELDSFNGALRRVNSLLYGYQDYAAIAWR